MAKLPPSSVLSCCHRGNSLSHPHSVFLPRQLDKARFAQLNQRSPRPCPSQHRALPTVSIHLAEDTSQSSEPSRGARGGADPTGELQVGWRCPPSRTEGQREEHGLEVRKPDSLCPDTSACSPGRALHGSEGRCPHRLLGLGVSLRPISRGVRSAICWGVTTEAHHDIGDRVCASWGLWAAPRVQSSLELLAERTRGVCSCHVLDFIVLSRGLPGGGVMAVCTCAPCRRGTEARRGTAQWNEGHWMPGDLQVGSTQLWD